VARRLRGTYWVNLGRGRDMKKMQLPLVQLCFSLASLKTEGVSEWNLNSRHLFWNERQGAEYVSLLHTTRGKD